jgi:pimeloyl-ACP methyl ester carboxylesterase
VAAEFALKFESVVNRLVLVSPAGSMKTSTKTLDEYILAALYPTNENARRAFFDMAYDPQTVTEDIIKDFVNRMKLPNAKYAFMSTLLGIRNIEDLTDRLKGIMSPTLLVWGEEDRMIPPSYADEYRKIPNSKLTVIPNSGHTPFTETPRSFANIVLNFIGPFNNIK